MIAIESLVEPLDKRTAVVADFVDPVVIPPQLLISEELRDTITRPAGTVQVYERSDGLWESRLWIRGVKVYEWRWVDRESVKKFAMTELADWPIRAVDPGESA